MEISSEDQALHVSFVQYGAVQPALSALSAGADTASARTPEAEGQESLRDRPLHHRVALLAPGRRQRLLLRLIYPLLHQPQLHELHVRRGHGRSADVEDPAGELVVEHRGTLPGGGHDVGVPAHREHAGEQPLYEYTEGERTTTTRAKQYFY